MCRGLLEAWMLPVYMHKGLFFQNNREIQGGHGLLFLPSQQVGWSAGCSFLLLTKMMLLPKCRSCSASKRTHLTELGY
jgi:hypothetical protein